MLKAQKRFWGLLYVSFFVSGTHVKSACTTAGEKGKCEECDYGTYTEHSNGLKQCFKCTQCRSGNSAWWLYTIDWNDWKKSQYSTFSKCSEHKLRLNKVFSSCFLRSGNCKAVYSNSRYWMSVQSGKILYPRPSMWAVQEVFKVSLGKLLASFKLVMGE